MTTQPIASSRRPSAPGHARHRRIHTATAIAGVAALIATAGYLAATTTGPDTAPPTPATGTTVNPNAQVRRELRESVAGQYGGQAKPGTTVNPNAQVRRELRESVAGQYGGQAKPGTTVNPNAQVRRELRESVAGQYGGQAKPGTTVNPNAQVRRELRESVAGQYGPAR